MTSLPSFIVVFLLMGGATGQSAPPAQPIADLERWVGQFSNPSWRERVEATEWLMDQGPEVFDRLRVEFNKATDYETRRRIRDVTREIYMTSKLGAPAAFLGISHNRADLRSADEPRIEPGCTALRIESVFPGTAAERAGIQPGDLLLSINGKKATLEEPAMNMTRWIASQRPGTRCKIGIFRGGHGIRLESARLREFSVGRFTKLKLLPVNVKEEPLAPTNGAGLRVVEKARLNDSLTLEPGDVIVALNDQLIPPNNPLGEFHGWIDSIVRMQQSGAQSEDVEIRIQNGRPQIVPKANASIQILRGGTKRELDLRLGRRPAYLRNALQSAWQADPAVIEQVGVEYEEWWTGFFDPSGAYVDQALSDPAWNLEPRQKTGPSANASRP